MFTPNRRSALLAVLSAWRLAVSLPASSPRHRAQERRAQRAGADAPDDKRWQAVAPGRVEPCSGEVKIAAPVIGLVGEVLVKANDKVFAGEPLIRLDDGEAQARLATAEAQIALRERVRDDETAPRARRRGARPRMRCATPRRR